jgi:hypothetical protein
MFVTGMNSENCKLGCDLRIDLGWEGANGEGEGSLMGCVLVGQKCIRSAHVKSASTCLVYEGRILVKTRYLKARQMRFEK